MDRKRLNSIARWLEKSVLSLAVLALVYRATIYCALPPPAGASYGSGDVIDFALAAILFVLALACAVVALGINLTGQGSDPSTAFRPAVVGITSFVVYILVHPSVGCFV